jgi:hypothetical protein
VLAADAGKMEHRDVLGEKRKNKLTFRKMKKEKGNIVHQESREFRFEIEAYHSWKGCGGVVS